jgi:hypothetical protein
MTEYERSLIKQADSCVDMIRQIKKSRRIMARFLRENLDFINDKYVKDKVNRKYVSDLPTERLCHSVIQVVRRMENNKEEDEI